MPQTHAATRAAGRTQAGRLVRLRGSSLGLVVMLIIMFILGMIYNLYGTAPTSKKPIGLFSGPVIALHVVLGILLGLAAIAQLVRAIGIRHSLSIWMSAVGLLSIIGAGLAGLGFTGSGANGASLGMSLAFATALASYVVLIVALPSSAAGAAAAPGGAAPGGAAPGAAPSSTT
jgi:hypothetical protein